MRFWFKKPQETGTTNKNRRTLQARRFYLTRLDNEQAIWKRIGN
jgi:hypothetical protein